MATDPILVAPEGHGLRAQGGPGRFDDFDAISSPSFLVMFKSISINLKSIFQVFQVYFIHGTCPHLMRTATSCTLRPIRWGPPPTRRVWPSARPPAADTSWKAFTPCAWARAIAWSATGSVFCRSAWGFEYRTPTNLMILATTPTYKATGGPQ